MAIHMAGVVMKAKLIAQSRSSIVGGLVLPFMLKMSFSFSLVRKTYWDLLHSSRLFFFQFAHIAFNSTDTDPDPNPNINNEGNNTRFRRALRLVYDRLTHGHFRRSQASPGLNSQQDSLHSLSMLAL